jgi:flavin-binding protein dodecin
VAEPFKRRSVEQGLFARLSGRIRSQASFVGGIEDVLARAPRVRDVPAARLGELAASRGVDLARRYRPARCNLYRRFLEHCLVDRNVSADETADLAHLRGLLQLDDADVARIHEDVVHAVYGSALDQVLKDHRLDPDEEEFLRRLGSALQIPPEAAERLYQEAEARSRQRFLATSMVREGSFLVGRDVAVELSGVSEAGFEDAIRRALDEASQAYPGIVRAEVTELAAELDADRVRRWRVKLKARRTPEA